MKVLFLAKKVIIAVEVLFLVNLKRVIESPWIMSWVGSLSWEGRLEVGLLASFI